MAINAGTVTAFLTLDTNRFNAGMESANAQFKALRDENITTAEKIQGVGGALTTIGGTLTRNVTLPLVGAGAAALTVAANFDEGMSKVQAISGATTSFKSSATRRGKWAQRPNSARPRLPTR